MKRSASADAMDLDEKRPCRDARLPARAAWRLRIEPASALRTWVENVGSVLGASSLFHVVATPGFTGLRVQGVDPTLVAQLQAEIAGDLAGAGAVSFRLPATQLALCLRGARPQDFVDLWGRAAGGVVYVRVAEPRSAAPQFEIQTLELVEEPLHDFGALRFPHVVALDLLTLQRAVRAGKDHHAKELQLQLLRPAAGGLAYLVLRFEGEQVRSEYALPCCQEEPDTETPEGSLLFRAQTQLEEEELDLAQATPVYHACFVLEMLHLFSRSLPHTLRLWLFLAPGSVLQIQAGNCLTDQRFLYHLAPRSSDGP